MSDIISNDNLIRIGLLGGFTLRVGDKEISDTTSRTHQLWNLLEYLITFRHKTISHDELIAALWPGDNIDNPGSALKNLIYRIRTTFISHNIPYAKDLIKSRHGTYSWNNEFSCITDIEEFERVYKLANDTETERARRTELYLQAIDIYKGDFLPGSCYESWVIPISTYYRSLYFDCVYSVLELLIDDGRWDVVEIVCNKALLIDQYEEKCHRYLLRSLINQKKSQKALAHYNALTDLFYRELGVRPSDNIRELYRDIVKTVNSVETDLSIIKDDLKESSSIVGAYYCDYEVFRNMYRVEARAAARNGQSIFIGLLTITDLNDDVPTVSLLNRGMDHLLQIIHRSLRKGDVVSRFSSTQYVLMLPSVSFESGEKVLVRLLRNYKNSFRNDPIKLYSKLLPLDPII